MAGVSRQVLNEKHKDYTCPTCYGIFKNPVRLKCTHSQCKPCLKPSSAGTITCPVCQIISRITEIADDEEFQQKVEELKIDCTQCNWSGQLKESQAHLTEQHQPETIMSNNTPQQATSDVQTNLIQCPLYEWGCANTFLPSQASEHFPSGVHMRTIISSIYSQKLQHESTLNNFTTNPLDTDTSPSAENYPRFIERLTTFLADNMQPFNPRVSDSIALSTIDLPSASFYTLTRNLIQQMDGDPNRSSNLQCHKEEYQLNETMMKHIASRIDSSYDSDDVYHRTEQGQEDQDPPSVNQETNIQLRNDDQHQTCSCKHLAISNNVLQIQLQDMPVSTDGNLVWRIGNINEKIENAINRSEPFIDSPKFQTSINGHQFWARLYLNGKNDHRFISLYVCLNTSINSPFSGRVKFILVDQSKNHTLEHITKRCSGEMENVGDYVGYDNFTDKNQLHMEENRFICDDSICFVILVEQTNQGKFAYLPLNVQDAMIQSQQV